MNILARGNPYAPEWMTGIMRPPETPAGFVDKHRVYSKTVTVTTGASLFNQLMPIAQNSDFIAREVGFFPPLPLAGVAYGDIQVRFRDGSGNRLSQDFLNPQDIEGPMFPEMLLPAGGNFVLDVKNVNAGSVTFQTWLRGVARYKATDIAAGLAPELALIENALYTPMYAAEGYSRPKSGQRDEPFVHFFSQALTASQLLSSFVLQFDPDADFYCRGLVGAYQTGAGLVQLRFSDAWQNRQQSALTVQENIAGAVTPAPIYPEVFLPANTTMTVDIQEYTAATCTILLAFYGVKRFKCD